MFIALLLDYARTVLAQHDEPPRHPQCPAPPDKCKVDSEVFGRTATFDSRFSKGGCNQNVPGSHIYIEQGTTRSGDEGVAQKWHRQLTERANLKGKTRRGITPKAQLKMRKNVVFRRPLPASIPFYQAGSTTSPCWKSEEDFSSRPSWLSASTSLAWVVSGDMATS